jgi:hypothetical protein
MGRDNEEYKLKKFTLLYIYGSGRCGSTLLDMLLNGHSRVIGLGEITTVMRLFNPLSLPEGYSIQHGREEYEQFWDKVRGRYRALLGYPFEQIDLRPPRWGTLMRGWNAVDMERWARQMEALLSSIHGITSKPMLAVASKLHHVLHLLLASGSFDIKVIHLVRDGRAVANFYIRRYNAFTSGVRLWTVTGVLAPWFQRRLGPDKWLGVKYEALATQPEESLKTICRFLGLDFEPAMLRFSCRPYFGIGGSPGTFSNAEERIFLDTRWHEELSWKHRLAFALMAGWLNRLYGYEGL